jgi:hypothetical protein
VLQEKQKNVHAFSIGILERQLGAFWFEDVDSVLDFRNARRVSYNPYRFPYFYEVTTETQVSYSRRVLVTANDGIYVEE